MNEMKNKKAPHYGNNSKMATKTTTLWEQFQNEKTKNTTLWKQFQIWIVSSGAGTAYLSRASEFTPGF